MVEYKAALELAREGKIAKALTKLEEIEQIFRSLNINERSPEFMYLRLQSSAIHRVLGNQAESEKLLLECIETNTRLFPKNVANRFTLHKYMSDLLLVKDIVLCHQYCDSEINQIFDAKKDYNQDEEYFNWLD